MTYKTYDNVSDETDKDISHRLDLDSKVGGKLADNDTDNHGNDDPDGQIGVLPHQSETVGDGRKGTGDLATVLLLIRVEDGLVVVGSHSGLLVGVFFAVVFWKGKR